MSRFIETIRIEDGRIHNLPYHNRRMDVTRRNVLHQIGTLDLSDYIRPGNYRERTKCRVEYDKDILSVDYAAYHIRPVSSLRLVVDDEVTYRYKSSDRSVLNRLFAFREAEDDVLIVRRGLLTDTSVCNVALWNGKQWVTPLCRCWQEQRGLLCWIKEKLLQMISVRMIYRFIHVSGCSMR